MSFGARRDNITVLAVVNAAGIALDPLIIFKGKNLMESWFGTNAVPNTCYDNSDKDIWTQRHLPNGLKNFARMSRNNHCF